MWLHSEFRLAGTTLFLAFRPRLADHLLHLSIATVVHLLHDIHETSGRIAAGSQILVRLQSSGFAFADALLNQRQIRPFRTCKLRTNKKRLLILSFVTLFVYILILRLTVFRLLRVDNHHALLNFPVALRHIDGLQQIVDLQLIVLVVQIAHGQRDRGFGKDSMDVVFGALLDTVQRHEELHEFVALVEGVLRQFALVTTRIDDGNWCSGFTRGTSSGGIVGGGGIGGIGRLRVDRGNFRLDFADLDGEQILGALTRRTISQLLQLGQIQAKLFGISGWCGL